MKLARSAVITAVIFAILTIAPAAKAANADQDTTPVTKCDGLPPSVSIPDMSWLDTTDICREMKRVLVGIRNQDITKFEKAIHLLHSKGYEGSHTQIEKELVEIIRLRGLYDNPDRWFETNKLIQLVWISQNGVTGPDRIIAILRDAGPKFAKSMSDEGLIRLIIVDISMYKSGDSAAPAAKTTNDNAITQENVSILLNEKAKVHRFTVNFKTSLCKEGKLNVCFISLDDRDGKDIYKFIAALNPSTSELEQFIFLVGTDDNSIISSYVSITAAANILTPSGVSLSEVGEHVLTQTEQVMTSGQADDTQYAFLRQSMVLDEHGVRIVTLRRDKP